MGEPHQQRHRAGAHQRYERDGQHAERDADVEQQRDGLLQRDPDDLCQGPGGERHEAVWQYDRDGAGSGDLVGAHSAAWDRPLPAPGESDGDEEEG